MSFLNKLTAGLTGGNKEKKEGKEGQKTDYVDKAFAAISKKAGLGFSAETQEKITDSAREAYEKSTGKKVDPKISN